MQILLLVGAGLICFLCYDVWCIRASQARWPKSLFWIGLLCDGAVTIWMLFHSASTCTAHRHRTVFFWCVGALFLLLLIYTLFFALPFHDTYNNPTCKRTVCRSGMYALCRHPGVIWFILFYLCLFLAAPSPVTGWGGSLLCISNLIYIVVQDVWSFPRTFSDYSDYRREVPFLIPTVFSIRRAWMSRPKRRRRP